MSENLILEIVEDEEEDLPKSQEELSSSKFDEITCRTVTSSSVVVQWIYLNQNLNHDVVVFKVLKLETRGEWKSVAWTRKTICQIENLEQNVCYSLKIHVLVEDETEFRVIDESEVFKCSIAMVPSFKTFIRAVSKSQINLIKSYLDLMPDYLHLTFKSHSALSLAVMNNDLNVAKLLLEMGADANIGIPEIKRTPLHIALFHGFIEMADLLIQHKADIRAKDALGLNIAHHAIDSSNLEAVEYCVETLGIHTETRDNNGLTLLLRSIVSRASLDIIRFLLDRKASQAVRDNNKMSILQHVRMTNSQELLDLLMNFKPKSKTDVKQKMKHNIQKLILSRQMKKEEHDDETGDESISVSVFEQSSLFK